MTTSDCFEYAENPHVNQNFRDKKYWNRKFQTQTKLWTLTELVTVYTQGPGVHFCARVQVLELVLGHWLRVRILAWVCLKKGCIHINTQRVPYLGTVSGHQV